MNVTAVAEKQSRLNSFFALNGGCSVIDYVTVRVTSAAAHGTARVEQAQLYQTARSGTSGTAAT